MWQDKVKQAYAAGYTDDQINAFLAQHGYQLDGQGGVMPVVQKQATPTSPITQAAPALGDQLTQSQQPTGDALTDYLTKTASNIPQDVGNIAGGVLKLPGVLWQNAQQNPNPWVQAANLGKGILSGYASSLNKDFGDPFAGGGLNAVLGRMASNFQNRPVSTTLDLLPFIQAGRAATAGRVAGAGEAADVAATAGRTENALTKAGNAVLRSQYNVPAKMAQQMGLNDVVSQLSEYGVRNPDQIPAIADKVTGADGAITQITRNAVAKTPNVDIGGISDYAQKLIDNEPLIGETAGNKFLTMVKKGVQSTGGDNPTAGDPTQTFQFIQDLEGKASTLRHGNDEAQALSRAYSGVADTLKDRLFAGTDANGNIVPGAGADNQIAQGALTPELLQQLNDVSPLLAQRAQQAKTIGELRSLARPFVRGSMLSDTSASRMDNALISNKDLGAGLVGAIAGGGPGAFALTVADKAIRSNRGLSALGGILEGAGQNISGASATLKNPLFTNILNKAGSSGALPEVPDNSQANQTKNGQNIHNPSITPVVNGNTTNSGIVASGDVKPDPKTGNYQLPDPASMNNEIPGQPYPLSQQQRDLADYEENSRRALASRDPFAQDYVGRQLQQIEQKASMNERYVNNFMQTHALDPEEKAFMDTAPTDNLRLNTLRDLINKYGNDSVMSALLSGDPNVIAARARIDPGFAQANALMQVMRSASVRQQIGGRVTGYELQLLNNVPQPGDTKAAALAKLDVIQQQLANQYKSWAPMYHYSLTSGQTSAINQSAPAFGNYLQGGQQTQQNPSDPYGALYQSLYNPTAVAPTGAQ